MQILKTIKQYYLGISFCFFLALFSWILSDKVEILKVIGAPVIAILLGMILNFFSKRKSPGLSIKEKNDFFYRKKDDFQVGIRFTSKKILQYAVIFLGFGLNLSTLGKVGLSSLPIILSTISVSLLVAYGMFRILKVPGKTAVLIGVGSSICGGSAIAATAPVINADDEEIAQSISVIFLFNVIAAILFPFLGGLIGLSNTGFGLFAGTAINDTSSVTAAASTWDTLHGTEGAVLTYATIVKLTRTLAIIPITMFLSVYQIRKEQRTNVVSDEKVSLKKIFPVFILYFVLASILTTIITTCLSGSYLFFFESIFSIFKSISKFMIIMAMGAIGLNTDILKLIKNGGKPILLGFLCWISITFISLLLLNLLNLY